MVKEGKENGRFILALFGRVNYMRGREWRCLGYTFSNLSFI